MSRRVVLLSETNGCGSRRKYYVSRQSQTASANDAYRMNLFVSYCMLHSDRSSIKETRHSNDSWWVSLKLCKSQDPSANYEEDEKTVDIVPLQDTANRSARTVCDQA